MGRMLSSTSNRCSRDTIMEVTENMIESLRRIAVRVTQSCPEYKDDAVNIMVIAIMDFTPKKKQKVTAAYLKRVAVNSLMEAIFRSRKYLFYSSRNRFPVERYDDDPYRYNQRHKHPSQESELISDILIARIFDDLTDDEKALLVMNFWGEVSLRDIGKLMGKSESTMRKRRGKLFEKIRERLDNGQYCEDQAGT